MSWFNEMSKASEDSLKEASAHERDVLGRHFGARLKDKYFLANLRVIVQAVDEEVFTGNGKQSQRKVARFWNRVLEEIQKRYGSYANIYSFKIDKNLGMPHLQSNIPFIYSTDKGNLYTSLFQSLEGIVFTSHSLDRLSLRYNPADLEGVMRSVKQFKDLLKLTALDLAQFLLLYIEGYSLQNGSIFLNCGQPVTWVNKKTVMEASEGGVFILEKVEDLYLVKTFYSDRMSTENWQGTAKWTPCKTPIEEGDSDFERIY